MIRRLETLGRSIATFVEDRLGVSPVTPEAAPTIRLKGFLEAEIPHIIDALVGNDRLTLPEHDVPPTVVVGRRGNLAGVRQVHLLNDERTLTWHRNHNEHGLVIIELDPQSDAQGLNFIDTLSDNDVLRDEDARTQRLRTITTIAWEVASEGRSSVPDVLQSEISALLEHVAHMSIPSLRRWVEFVDVAVSHIASTRRAVTGREVRAVLAASLQHLRLFPDDYLYERQFGVARRLERNFHMAGLRTPQGRDIRIEDLEAKIETVEIRGADGEPLSTEGLVETRAAMRAILEGTGVDDLARIQLRLWEQLFERRVPAVGLGAQIREFLVNDHPTRVAEYDGLEVQAGLDDGEADAAERLLRADESDEELPLVDILRKDLRRRVERLVFSGEQESTDPLRTILYGINAVDLERVTLEDDEPRPAILLEWERLHDEGALSARLFALLYGPTLLQVSADSSSGLGGELTVDSELVTTGSLTLDEPLEREDDESQERIARAWVPLRLTLRMATAGTPLLRFRWSPSERAGLVALARIVEAGGHGGGGSISSLDEFVASALNVLEPLPIVGATTNVDGETCASTWRSAFREHALEWARTGLSVEGLDEFLATWSELLGDARETLVPTGDSLPALDEFLDQDVVRTEAGTWVMLATHPLRLRWIREHLKNMRTWLAKALAGELDLNPENDGLFFDWIDRVSPHRQPALISPQDRVLATAAREHDWHEEFMSLDSNRALQPDAVMDDSSVEELVRACQQFLHSYPHKIDGFSILLLLRGRDTRTPRLVLQKLLHREFSDINLTMHVVAQRQDHESIARSLRDFDDGHGRGTAMFPRLQLMLHSWDAAVPTAIGELRGQIDVALAPNLFGVNAAPLTETRTRSEGVSGRFDAWLDPATHVRSAGGVNVSQVMLPATPDPTLEAWSTLAVRRHRRAVVKHDDPASTDFITLQVLFDANRRLFARLHDAAHWVVTLDPFVGRDQIDALEQRPDIILVREGVGKNETYTLVVSSSAGRPFVTERLQRRLTGDLGFSSEDADALASRLYDVGRDVCPGLMLRALGLGRSTEEILGLISARYICDQDDPGPGHGVEFWIGLDEHAHWFGGTHRTRPDMLRATLIRTPVGAELRLLVVESKFRKSLDLSIADQQLDAGTALLRAAFVTGEEGNADDALFWRRELHRAFRQLSRTEQQNSDLPAVRAIGDGLTDQEIDNILLDGNYRCEEVASLVVAAAWDQERVNAGSETPGRHPMVGLGRDELRSVLLRLEEGEPASVSLPNSRRSESETVGEPPQSPRTLAGSPRESDGSEIVDSRTTVALSEDVADRGLGDEGREQQYQRLLDRLDRLGVPVTRGEPPHGEGPRFAVYRVVPEPAIPIDRVVGRTQELKLALDLSADQFIRAFVDRGSVVFEVPKDEDHSFVVSAASLWARTASSPDSLAVPLGVDIADQVVEIDFSSSDTPHLLIAGQTGSGKSVALETLLTGLCRRKGADVLRLHLVDPKGTELLDLADDPHVEGEIGYLAEDAIQVLGAGVAEMERRYSIFRNHRARSLPEFNAGVSDEHRLPWWLIVLDEYADLTSDSDDRKAIEAELRRIAQKGRAAGIHLIVATQRPSADVIGTVIRSNLPAQLALRVKSGTDSRLIIDESGAETLAGKGDAFLRTAKGLVRIQCALVAG